MNSGSEGFYGERSSVDTFTGNSRGKAIFYNSTSSFSSPSQSQSQLPNTSRQLQLFPARGVLHQPSGEDETEEEEDAGSSHGVEKEHMFDKVVTPSDVGKLNRLVIPKQHAEKYFPLDSSSNVKGLLLNFEDRNGKAWRFRYSYWNSSQSYVITKGWSRFVKDKRLEAGDIVSFKRGLCQSAKNLLFIDWKRRSSMPDFPAHRFPLSVTPWPPLVSSYLPNFTSNGHIFGLTNAVNPIRGRPVVYESVPVVHGKNAVVKRLRLFGVNVECPISSSDSDHHHHHHHNDTSYSSSLMSTNNNDVSTTMTLSHHATLVPHQLQLSSAAQLPLHLRLHNGIPLSPTRGFLNKGKSSSLSLELEM